MTIAGEETRVTCVGMGNPHCVVFRDAIDALDLTQLGPEFQHSALFPQVVNVEFARVVSRGLLRLRVWERGNGETLACGTGACAAVVAAVENGLCAKNMDIQVQVPGGKLLVRYTDAAVYLTGKVHQVYEDTISY